MSEKRERTIFLADCQSFYASVEKTAHPELRSKPIAVGDPARRGGIVLAACPMAKLMGVTTAMRNFEAIAICPDLTIIRPRMQTYIDVSLLITEIYESFTDLVEPWSIDEQFIDVTGSISLFGSAEDIARQMQSKVMLSTGVWIRAGISSTKILAKTATDNFAKKMESGIFTLNDDNIESELWPLHVSKMYMVASKMTYHFTRMGISTIGDIARMDLGEFKRRMKVLMGRQSDIAAEYYWQTARGIDPSPVVSKLDPMPKSITRGRTVQSNKYKTIEEISPLLLELVIEVCRTSRKHGRMGRVVKVSVGTTEGGFSRQMTIDTPSCLETHIVETAWNLFMTYWNGAPITHISIDLSQLSDNSVYQLDMFENIERKMNLAAATDAVKNRFGSASIIRASSLHDTAQAKERAVMIGGHYA